ncbi:MAG: ABC transporter permease subunit [Lachnospiraceae bacterium]|nr:ABC transporter permease subunit [Lachnospiraceae bacterium]
MGVKAISFFNSVRKNWGLYLLLAPAIVLLILFTYKPMYGITIAFKDFNTSLGITDSPWVGFKHFERFFNSFLFGTTIRNTITLSLYNLIVAFPLPIIMALCINQMRVKYFRKVFQIVTYMPHFISTVVLVGLMLLVLSPSVGVAGLVARVFGVDPVNLMAIPEAFRHLFVWSDVWQNTGWDSIIYLAALSAISPALYEAADIDGASKFQKLLYIDIPMILPTMIVLLILRSGNLMNIGFEKVFLMQNSLNIMQSEVISTYVYKIGLLNMQYSLSAAVNLFNNVINFILLITVNQISKRVSNSSLW